MTKDNQDGVASVDGMMEADEVADETIEAMRRGEFLVLPHKDVLKYTQRKAADRDRWIGGMQRLLGRYLEAAAQQQAKL